MLSPGGVLLHTDNPIPGNLTVAKLAVTNNLLAQNTGGSASQAAEILADSSLDTSAAFSDLGVSLVRTSDKNQDQEDLLFGRPANKKRAQKAQTGEKQANARKIALKTYGKHAEDTEAAPPVNTGNGDKFAMGQASDIGSPGIAGTNSSTPPLLGADPGGSIPFEALQLPPYIRGGPLGSFTRPPTNLFTPIPEKDLPPICEQCSRVARMMKDDCTTPD